MVWCIVIRSAVLTFWLFWLLSWRADRLLSCWFYSFTALVSLMGSKQMTETISALSQSIFSSLAVVFEPSHWAQSKSMISNHLLKLVWKFELLVGSDLLPLPTSVYLGYLTEFPLHHTCINNCPNQWRSLLQLNLKGRRQTVFTDFER